MKSKLVALLVCGITFLTPIVQGVMVEVITRQLFTS
jgi:hypothetical protein